MRRGDTSTMEPAGPGMLLFDFLTTLIGAGAMLYMLHLLGILTLIERWAALL